MVRKGIQAIGLLVLIVAAGCVKVKPVVPQLPTNDSGSRVFIVCEGSLGNGNSALGLYLPEQDSVFEDVYKAANGEALGDIFQSMTRIGDQYFLCINNSDLIKVINKDTWKREGPNGGPGLIGVNKPRYILPVSAEKAYVSSLFSNQLMMINPLPSSQMSYGSIRMPYKNPEGMALLNGKVYVALWDTACTQLFALNPSLPGNPNPITDSITLPGRAPQEVLVDKDQKLWVLAGNVSQGKTATLTRIDPVTNRQLQVYIFPGGADPIRPVFNEARDTLYFIEVNYNGGSSNNGVYRMSIEGPSLPTQPFIAAQGFQYFWALGIQPRTGHIFVGDPKGFTQRGTVNIYQQNGALLKSFATGVGPGHFFFD